MFFLQRANRLRLLPQTADYPQSGGFPAAGTQKRNEFIFYIQVDVNQSGVSS